MFVLRIMVDCEVSELVNFYKARMGVTSVVVLVINSDVSFGSFNIHFLFRQELNTAVRLSLSLKVRVIEIEINRATFHLLLIDRTTSRHDKIQADGLLHS